MIYLAILSTDEKLMNPVRIAGTINLQHSRSRNDYSETWRMCYLRTLQLLVATLAMYTVYTVCCTVLLLLLRM